MKKASLLVSIAYFVVCIVAHDITNIKIQLEPSEIKVTFSDDPEVKSVFFLTEIGDHCTSNYTFVHNVNESNLVSINIDMKENPKNDMLRIFSIIEIKDKEVIAKSYDFKFDEHGHGTKVNTTATTVTKPIPCNGQKFENEYNNELKCLQAEADSDTSIGCSGRIIFEENFKDNKLTQWTHAVYSRVYTKHAEFSAFLKDRKNCYVKDKQLHFDATLSAYKLNTAFKLSNCTYSANDKHRKKICGPFKLKVTNPPPLHSAILHTKGKFSFKYGRIEIRAKMPIGDWLFPYLLLQPVDTEVEEYDYAPHIRVAYVRGNPELRDYAHNDIGGNTLFGSVFSRINSDRVLLEYMMNMPLKSGSHYGEDFHNFTLIRHRDRIIFKVDGVTYGTISDEMIIHDINRIEYYVVLGLTAGGNMNFRDIYVKPENRNNFKLSSPQAPSLFRENFNSTNWKHPKLVIDHVHVYTTHVNEN